MDNTFGSSLFFPFAGVCKKRALSTPNQLLTPRLASFRSGKVTDLGRTEGFKLELSMANSCRVSFHP